MTHSISRVQLEEDGYLKYQPQNSRWYLATIKEAWVSRYLRMYLLVQRLPLYSGYTIQPCTVVLSRDQNRGIHKRARMHTYISKTGKSKASAPIQPVIKMGCRRTSPKLASHNCVLGSGKYVCALKTPWTLQDLRIKSHRNSLGKKSSKICLYHRKRHLKKVTLWKKIFEHHCYFKLPFSKFQHMLLQLSQAQTRAQAQCGVLLVQTKHSENQRRQFCGSRWDMAGMVTLGLGLSNFKLSVSTKNGESRYQLFNEK